MARLLRGTIHQQGLALDDEAVEKMVSLGCSLEGPCHGFCDEDSTSHAMVRQ